MKRASRDATKAVIFECTGVFCNLFRKYSTIRYVRRLAWPTNTPCYRLDATLIDNLIDCILLYVLCMRKNNKLAD